MVKLTKEREAIILECIKANSTKTSSDITKILRTEPYFIHFKSISFASLRIVVGKVRKDNDLYQVKTKDTVTVDVTNDTKWIVDNDKYNWKASKGEISLDVNFVDQLFYEYSEYGCNLTQTEIINKHNLGNGIRLKTF